MRVFVDSKLALRPVRREAFAHEVDTYCKPLTRGTPLSSISAYKIQRRGVYDNWKEIKRER